MESEKCFLASVLGRGAQCSSGEVIILLTDPMIDRRLALFTGSCMVLMCAGELHYAIRLGRFHCITEFSI